MTPRFMTDAEREEIAAIEARCKALFEEAFNNLFVAPASADTHPKGGDVKQAPLVSGAVPEGQTPKAQRHD